MKSQLGICSLLIALIAVSSMSTSAHAQWYAGAAAGYAYGAGGGGWGGAQTPESAFATGMGNLVRSQGEYNELTARAAISYQQARSLYIDNQQKAFAAKQSIQRAARAQDFADWEAAKAGLARADEFIAAHQPLPLSNGDLNPSTGHIEWPVGLTGKDFEEGRNALDSLFESRMKSGATARLASQIEMKTSELKDALREHIMKMPLKDYSEARRFLDSMYASAR